MAPLPAGLWTTKSLTLDRMSAQRDEKVSGSSKVVTRGIWSDIEPLPTWNTLAGFFQRLELLPILGPPDRAFSSALRSGRSECR
jgi:hypothetical protein